MTPDWCRVWGLTCENLLHHHPGVLRDDFVFVEDERTGEIVSTTCLLPWKCKYEDVTLNAAMLEEVGTHPEYRQRGLIRAQMGRFHRSVEDRGFDFSIIWGIPYFYRQFGYTYVFDMLTADTIPAWEIPEAGKSEKSRYMIRKAVLEDAEVLAGLYQRSRASLQIYDTRDLNYWKFLLKRMKYPARLIIDTITGEAVGYFCVEKLEEKEGIKVFESAIFSFDAGMFVFRHLKLEYGNEIQLGWPETGELVKLGRSLGSAPMAVYQWLLRVPDIVGLISKISPVLERRIERSVFKDMTRDFCVNLYKRAFTLRFRHGKLEKVEKSNFVNSSLGAEGGDINIPPDAFLRLVFGYRRLDQLIDAWPDITVKPESRLLVDVLFPFMTSYFILPWQYYGLMGL